MYELLRQVDGGLLPFVCKETAMRSGMGLSGARACRFGGQRLGGGQLEEREGLLITICDQQGAGKELLKACCFVEWRHFFQPLICHSPLNTGFAQETKQLRALG